MSGGRPLSPLAKCVSHSPITSGFSGELCIAVLSLSSLFHNPAMFKCHTVALSVSEGVSVPSSLPAAVIYVLLVNL